VPSSAQRREGQPTKRKRLFNAKNSSLFFSLVALPVFSASLSASANLLSGGRSIRVVRRLIHVDGGAEGREKELIAESVVDSKTLQFVLHRIFELGKT
jgi:hypothetical protein